MQTLGETQVRALQTLDTAGRRDWLQTAGLANAHGIDTLLATAQEYAERNADVTALLAALAADVAPAYAPDRLPDAHYTQARAALLHGAFEPALALTAQARDGFAARGDTLAVARTTIGTLAILAELGRYDEALATAAPVLAALDTRDEPAAAQLAARLYQNVAQVHYQRGDYPAAIDANLAAEARADGLPALLQAQLRVNRALALLSLGRAAEALALIAAARTEAATLDAPLWQARLALNDGYAHLQTGAVEAALAALESARRLYSAHGATIDGWIAQTDAGEAYLTVNLALEAQAELRPAAGGLADADMPYEHGRALLALGSAQALTGDSAALATLQAAATRFRQINNRPLLMQTLLEIAALVDDPALLAEAAQLAATTTAPVQRFFVLARRFDAALAADDDTEAAEVAAALGAAAAALPIPPIQYHWLLRRGRLARRAGDWDDAESALLAAGETVEALRGTLVQEALRTSFMADKSAVWHELIALYLARGDAMDSQRAFAIAERARARTLVELMLGALDSQLAAALPPAEHAQLQTLRADLNALYNTLLAGDDGARGALPQLQSRAVALEQAIAALERRAAAAATPVVLTRTVRELPPAELLAARAEGVPVIAYQQLGDEWLAFVLAGGTLHTVRRLAPCAAVDAALARLATQWGHAYAGAALAPRHAEQLTKSAQRALHELYRLLFTPLEPLLGAAPALVVVPDGALFNLPFHALFDGTHYLLDRFEFGYAPSVTVHALVTGRAAHVQPSIRQLALFGVDDPALPHIGGEINAIAADWPGAQRYQAATATRAALLDAATRVDQLHIACHGLFRADNPRFSALRLADGWVTAEDIGRLPQAPAVVTLSACDAGRQQPLSGETLGLLRAFLAAGSQTVVAALWPVQDSASAWLMPAWYANMRAGARPAHALRAAQVALREIYPHPFHWAPFALFGRG